MKNTLIKIYVTHHCKINIGTLSLRYKLYFFLIKKKKNIQVENQPISYNLDKI